MKKSLLLKVVVIVFAFLGFVSSSNAQVTTSSMAGLIRDAKGALPGANVKATHTPSGTVYNASTNNDGRFLIGNARVGGPYTIEVSYVGLKTGKISDVFLKLGETYTLDYSLDDSGTILSEVTIKGARSKNTQQKTGASTNISSRDLVTLPTISRSIADFTRLTPQAGTGLSSNSFGGRDARYNNIQVDGANLNNNFGLNTDPLPGGGSQPISLDSYDQISVNIAPYDVRQAGFTGANISAVTKSGTNTFHGSAYGLYRDQSFIGTKIGSNDISSSIADSKSKTYGFTLGGPIIKNKLFFFVNAEKEENLAPGIAFYPKGGTGSGTESSTTVGDLKLVSDYLKSKFGYETGAYDNFPGFGRDNHKILAKVDWNINNSNKLTLKYSDFRGTDDQTLNSTSVPNGGGFKVTGQASTLSRAPNNRFGPKSASFENSNYGFLNTTKSGTLELNSTINNRLSNQLILAFTKNKATRDYPGSIFPTIDIYDGTTGGNYITAGMDPYTLNNDVVNDVYNFTNNLTYNAGKHIFTGGLTYEYQKVGNMFMAPANSYYVFNSLNDLLTDKSPVYFAYTYSLVPGKSSVYSAELKIGQAGAYIQDEYNVTDNFKLTMGLRADMPIYHEDPLNNPTTSALNFYAEDNATLRNYRTDKWAKSRVLLSPRIGFRMISPDKTTTLRGGLGIFTGKIPFVFLTNIPTNTGMYQFGGAINNNNAAGIAALNGIKLSGDPNAYANLFPKTAGTSTPSNVVFMDENFKFPKVFRVNLGVDKNLGNGYMFTFDGLYTKDMNAVKMRNANLTNINGIVAEGDLTRPRIVGTNKLNAGVNSAIVLENSEKGYATSLTGQLSKTYSNGFSASVAYTFTAAKEITANPGSQASSVWNTNPNVGTSNFQELGNSAYAVPHRVIANLSYRREYLKHLATTVSLFFEGANQGVFSYVLNGDINGDGNSSADLMYIPKAGETKFEQYVQGTGSAAVTFTVAEQEAAFEQFINNSPYLKKHRGEFAARNAALLPWLNKIDVRLMQDIFINTGKNARKQTLQFTADITNAGNLINKNWGTYQRTVLNNPLTFRSIDASNKPTYRLQNVSSKLVTNPFQDLISPTSTYSIQLGLRYIF
ncbi:TonB-dependent receptor [Pedobacter insulae]|uniref:Carboxypeptidase regulatory-like domain-containing protein n=1 Tax=Pedobacter insulae TaxID=414048 RepID=A0A1I2VMM1_9SPHI|nr:carboxypeptidase regulatory-like domain-containing protein [Pedobacter insulae]SFG88441.1 Carboxypeptidase regulatory-like domain-containing protein [Pedobacter insulae]